MTSLIIPLMLVTQPIKKAVNLSTGEVCRIECMEDDLTGDGKEVVEVSDAKKALDHKPVYHPLKTEIRPILAPPIVMPLPTPPSATSEFN